MKLMRSPEVSVNRVLQTTVFMKLLCLTIDIKPEYIQ